MSRCIRGILVFGVGVVLFWSLEKVGDLCLESGDNKSLFSFTVFSVLAGSVVFAVGACDCEWVAAAVEAVVLPGAVDDVGGEGDFDLVRMRSCRGTFILFFGERTGKDGILLL